MFPFLTLTLHEIAHKFTDYLRCRPVKRIGFGHEVGPQIGLKLHRENGFFRHATLHS